MRLFLFNPHLPSRRSRREFGSAIGIPRDALGAGLSARTGRAAQGARTISARSWGRTDIDFFLDFFLDFFMDA
jgi:hypothetical protein